jgi:hypothetical protein
LKNTKRLKLSIPYDWKYKMRLKKQVIKTIENIA